MMSDKPLRILDTCSGIGGFSYAAEYLSGGDFETAAFIEINDYCRQVLRARWPHTPIYSDIKEYDYDQERDGDIAILTAGYPCQPFSKNGKRRGEKDSRHLWPEVFRIIKQCKPQWCIFENVPGHLSLGIEKVLSEMGSEGYSSQVIEIPALAVDASHIRERIWIVACKEKENNPDVKKYYKLRHKPHPDEFFWTTPIAKDTGADKSIIDGIRLRKNGTKAGLYLLDKVRFFEGVDKDDERGLNPEWIEWLMGYPKKYTDISNEKPLKKPAKLKVGWSIDPAIKSGLPRLIDRSTTRNKRNKALGNSIVPQIPARFFDIIDSVEQGYKSC